MLPVGFYFEQLREVFGGVERQVAAAAHGLGLLHHLRQDFFPQVLFYVTCAEAEEQLGLYDEQIVPEGSVIGEQTDAYGDVVILRHARRMRHAYQGETGKCPHAQVAFRLLVNIEQQA